MRNLVPVADSIPDVVLSTKEKADIKTILSINLPIPPQDITKLPDYINVSAKFRDAMKKMATRYVTQGLNPQIYNMALDRAIECGELVLRAELTLSTYLKQIKTKQGKRTDLEYKKFQNKVKEEQKTKSQVIKEKYGLTPEQAKKISMLEEWAVEAAIKQGWDNRQIPTRAMAILMIKEKHKAENNKKYNPDAIYMDYVPYPEDIMRLPPIRSTTLCSNVGIGEYFLEYAHVRNCVAAEVVPKRVTWYKETYPSVHMIEGDLFKEDIQQKVIDEHIKQGCKLIIATPPCQSFSLAGNRDFTRSITKLFIPILNIIEAVNEVNDYVLIENVPQYMTACPKHLRYILEDKTIVEYIKYKLEQLGYEVNIDILNAANYGTPQARKRMILLASKKGMWKFPIPFEKQITLMEAIGNLPSLEAGPKKDRYQTTPALTNQEVEMLKHTPTGKSAWDNAKDYQPQTKSGEKSGADRKSRFKRERWDKPASTITSESGNISGMNTVHPGRPLVDKEGNVTYSDARVYTLQEKLILLGFPDNIYSDIWSKNKPKYKVPAWANDKLINEVLGESFLPRLATVLAETIPNRTAHPDEKLEDYPKAWNEVNDSDDCILTTQIVPVVDYMLRYYEGDGIYHLDEDDENNTESEAE